MTEVEYKAVWSDTERAAKYLHNHNRATVCTSAPCGYGNAHLLTYSAANVTDAERKHIAHVYPAARISYTSIESVAVERLTRDICAARMLVNDDQEPESARMIARSIVME